MDGGGGEEDGGSVTGGVGVSVTGVEGAAVGEGLAGGGEEAGGPTREEPPRRVTRASPGDRRMTAVHAPEGSSARSTRTTSVTDSPARNVPRRAEKDNQYAPVDASHRTTPAPRAVSVTYVVRPGPGRAATNSHPARPRLSEPFGGVPPDTATDVAGAAPFTAVPREEAGADGPELPAFS